MKNYYYRLLLAVLPVFFCFLSQAQIRTVKGVLVDPQDGSPLPGVSIFIKGTTQGTTTDTNGYYELQAPIGATLVISYVGYTTQEVTVPPLTDKEKQEEKRLQTQLDSLKMEQAKVKTFRHTIPDSPEDKTLSPYFFVKSDNPTLDAMPLKSTSASVNISGVMAEVTVKQVYVNEGKQSLEAIYIFPGSTRAAVYGMSMQVGHRKINAKIQEKVQARQEYEQAIQAGKTATLLEQKRPNVFQMNVGNILPKDTITVELKYIELLTATDGTYEFVYPTVVGPRYSETPDNAEHQDEKWVQNPYLTEGKAPTYSFALKTRLNAGLPIQKVYCPSHQVNVAFADKNTAEVDLAPSESAGGNRDYILRYRLRGGKVESGLLLHPGKDENFFLLMVQPPDKPTPDQIPPREYVFILDVSGSMHGFPLDVSKQLMGKLLDNLRPEDRFNVILFAGTSSIFAENESVEATGRNVGRAMQFINRQQGSGGTSLLPALQRALALKGTENYARTFVLVTDGYVEVEKQAFELVKKNLNEANFFAFGIGTSVNRYLMEGLAQAGMGEPFFASNEAEARQVGDKFREMIESPVLTNIRLDFGGLNVYDVEPTSIPDVFAERPIIVFGKYKGAPQGTVHLSGISGQNAYRQQIDVATARTENNQALRYLWARERIKYWDDYAQFFEAEQNYYNSQGKVQHSSNQQQAITELGLKYNLLTAYTSFIAVDSVVRTNQPPIEVKQHLPLPKGVSNFAVGGAVAGVQIRGFSSVIGLTPDIKSLCEVVVVGYGVQTKQSLTSSITTIQSSPLENLTNGSVDQALQGRVTGVVANQNSGSPGGSSSVRIRGNSSVALSNSPLYVVDGVPVDNSESDNGTGGFDNANRMEDLSPDDIESVQVIKGAGASALYGSRGAEGVIVVTTKNGRNKRGKYPRVSVSSSFATEQVNKLPEVQNEFAQGRPLNGALTWQGSNEPFSWGPKISDLELSDDGRLVAKGSGNGLSAPTYQPDQFFRNGSTLHHFISIGHDKNTYRWNVGLGNQYRRGVVPNTDLTRNTLRLSADRQLRKLKLGLTGSYTSTHSDQALRGNNPSGVLLGLLTTPPTFNNQAGYEWPDGTQQSAGGLYDNPYWSSEKNRQQTRINHFVGRLQATYEFAPHLQLQADFNADQYTDERHARVATYSAGQMNGRLMQRRENFLNWQSSLLLNYEKNWNDFTLNATTGFIYRHTQRAVNRTDGTGLISATVSTPETVMDKTIIRQDFRQQNLSSWTKASLHWRSIVNLDFQLMNEWTTTMPVRHLLSPSVGASIQVMDLLALSSQWINSGKIFASYGQIQKEAPLFVDANLLLANILPVMGVEYNFERRATQNDRISKPESNTSLELGTDWQFFDGRLSLQSVYYRNQTRNLYIPAFENQAIHLRNGGTLLNKGWEVDLTVIPLRTNNFTWNSILHFTKYQSMVQSLTVERVALAGFQSISSSLVAGQPYGVLYGTRYQRNENGQLIIGADGFPLVDTKMGVLGNPNPDWLAGIENTLRWKRLEFSFLFDFRKGGILWNGTQNTLNYLGTSALTGEQRGITQYVFEGVNAEGKPNTIPVNFADNQSLENNRWVRYGRVGVDEDAIEAASWLRLRNVSLTYTFNRNLLSRLRIDQLSMSVFARNAWLSTRYSGVDPETNLTGNSNGRGLDYFNNPNVKSFGASLRIGF